MPYDPISGRLGEVVETDDALRRLLVRPRPRPGRGCHPGDAALASLELLEHPHVVLDERSSLADLEQLGGGGERWRSRRSPRRRSETGDGRPVGVPVLVSPVPIGSIGVTLPSLASPAPSPCPAPTWRMLSSSGDQGRRRPAIRKVSGRRAPPPQPSRTHPPRPRSPPAALMIRGRSHRGSASAVGVGVGRHARSGGAGRASRRSGSSPPAASGATRGRSASVSPAPLGPSRPPPPPQDEEAAGAEQREEHVERRPGGAAGARAGASRARRPPRRLAGPPGSVVLVHHRGGANRRGAALGGELVPPGCAGGEDPVGRARPWRRAPYHVRPALPRGDCLDEDLDLHRLGPVVCRTRRRRPGPIVDPPRRDGGTRRTLPGTQRRWGNAPGRAARDRTPQARRRGADRDRRWPRRWLRSSPVPRAVRRCRPRPRARRPSLRP